MGGWVAFAVYTETAAGHALDDRVRTLQQENAQLRAQVDERRREIAAAQSSSWLQEEARRLGYVMPGEKVYVLSTPGVPVPPEGGVDAAPIGGSSAPPSGKPTPTPSPPPPAGTGTPSPTPYTLTVPPGH